MAILWEKSATEEPGGQLRHYQVRSAGRSRRLYTNGVFHSQYNPSRPVAGSVWDLLLLPAFLMSAESVRRVLLLGVGGGAVIRQLLHFLPHVQVTGIELNPVHVDIARTWFGLPEDGVELVVGDAQCWAEEYEGPPFDLLIDDLFSDGDGEPMRAIEASQDWCETLMRMVSPEGTLVMNFDSPSTFSRSHWGDVSNVERHWQRAYFFQTRLYHNQILALTRQTVDRSVFRHRLRQHRELDERKSACALNYQMHSIRLRR